MESTHEQIKPTKEQFKDWLVIQKSGVTNMHDLPFVCAKSLHGLMEESCFYIMSHYEELMKEYKISYEDITDQDIEDYAL